MIQTNADRNRGLFDAVEWGYRNHRTIQSSSREIRQIVESKEMPEAMKDTILSSMMVYAVDAIVSLRFQRDLPGPSVILAI